MTNALRRARMKDEEGLSLIELMVAVFILSVAIIALAGIASSSVMRVRVARDQQQASDLASAELEAARGLNFDTLALASAPLDPAPGDYSTENLVVTAGAPLVPLSTVAQGSQTFTVHRWVTAPTPAAAQDPIKRVVVSVRWADRGTPRTVTDSTVIAPADRGLAVPQFDIEPETQVVTLSTDSPSGPDGPHRECVTHLVTNLGIPDTYEWRLENRNDSSAVSVFSNGVFRDAARKLTMRAYFQVVEDGVPTNTDPTNNPYEMNVPETSVGGTWFKAQKSAADPVTRLGSRESARLSVCYTTEQTPPDSQNLGDYRVRLRSVFDRVVDEAVVNRTSIGPSVLLLYLHETNHRNNWSPGTSHNRKSGSVDYPIMPMDTTQNPNVADHDMDQDHDPVDLPGLYLPNTGTLAERQAAGATWDFTVASPRTIAALRLHLHGAFSGTVATPTPALGVTVQRVSTSTGAVVATVLPATKLDIPTTTAGAFVPLFLGADVSALDAATRTLNPNEWLRLRVWCHEESNVPCHVLFDTASASNSYPNLTSPSPVQRGVLEVVR